MKSWLHFLAVVVVVLIGISGSTEARERDVRKFNFPIPFIGGGGKETNHVKFYLYTRETLDNPEVVDSRDPIPFSNLKPDRPTKVTIHGWKGYSNCTFTFSMKNAFMAHSNINLITVDWSGHGSRTNIYPSARSQVPEVGRLVAEFLDLLAEKGKIKLARLHVLGHSLGGHIAGIAGQQLKHGKIGRITGFDPAGPQFSVKDTKGRLTNESAHFVDVIHTTANFLGFGKPIGHVDFYPNSGHAVQPGCGLDVIGKCSHRRSYELYIESVADPEGFPAVACDDWKEFRQNSCNYQDIIYMGENTKKTARGKYYFQTNKEVPFLRKLGGTLFSSTDL